MLQRSVLCFLCYCTLQTFLPQFLSLNMGLSNTFQAITFHRCKNLKVKNLMIVNSQKMHMAFTNCMRVVASHLQVIAPATSPNTDGIHISVSKGVEVKDSIIRTGDSLICPEKLLEYITLFSLLDPIDIFVQVRVSTENVVSCYLSIRCYRRIFWAVCLSLFSVGITTNI